MHGLHFLLGTVVKPNFHKNMGRSTIGDTDIFYNVAYKSYKNEEAKIMPDFYEFWTKIMTYFCAKYLMLSNLNLIHWRQYEKSYIVQWTLKSSPRENFPFFW